MNLKVNFNNAVIGLAVVAGCGGSASPSPGRADPTDLLRVVSVLDYVATDYPGAVRDGRVVNEAEYAEQLAFVETARRLLLAAGPAADPARGRSLRRDLATLRAAVRAKADASRIRSESRALRRRLVAAYDLVLSPAAPPSAARGRALFSSLCARCHGSAGLPPPEKIAQLRPPPANLLDPARMADLPPYRVFNTVTFGVDGTSMAAFDTLPEADRWDLSFFVSGLPHASEAASAGEVPTDVRGSLHLLATESDRGIASRLARRGVDRARIPAAVAWLRTEAPYRLAVRSPPLATARRLVDESVVAYAAGRRDRARALALDAYLEGFEPMEATLRTRSAGLVRETEEGFGALRVSIDRGEDPDHVRLQGRRLAALLSRAEESGQRRQSASMAFVSSFLILLREGIEAALVVAALLALLGKLERREAKRAVHGGWIAALGAGGATWLLGRELLRRAGRAEWMEGVVTILAAAVLFWASYWLLSQAESRRWMAYLKRQVERGASRGGLLSVFGIAFLAVYREAFETALFYEALVGDGSRALAIGAGAALGAVVLVGFIFVFMRQAVRLPIQTFFGASGAILSVLCVVFVGHGIHELQGAGAVPIRPLGAVRFDALGVYPDAVSLSAQAAIVAVYLASLLVKRSAARSPSVAPESKPTTP